jgi:outer membrane lipoprotein SlyB
MKKLAILVCALSLGACATRGAGYQPIIDAKGVSQAQYNVDLSECQQYAHRVSAGDSAAVGAVAGALLGAFLAPRGHRSDVAGRGAVLGALAGGGQGVETQESIIKRCLAGRGYSVLQ